MSGHPGAGQKEDKAPKSSNKLRAWKLIGFVLWMIFAFAWKMYGRRYESIAFSQSACDIAIADPAPPFYSRIYSSILRWERGDSTSRVVEIVIPADLADVQQNVCLGREYLADLLQTLDRQEPSVIVVDKYFSPNTCSHAPSSTAKLVNTLATLKAPVVVGESTQLAVREVDTSCLIKENQLYLGANVSRGVTRLNVNKEEIPLEWNVLPRPPKPPSDYDVRSVPTASLALVAARAARANIIKTLGFLKVREAERQPYAYIRRNIDHETSTDVLCNFGTASVINKWSLSCSGNAPNLDLHKVVVVGAEAEGDSYVVLDQRLHGYELQANYIDALLSGRFMRAPTNNLIFWLYVLFLFVLDAPEFAGLLRNRWPQLELSERIKKALATVWMCAFILLVSLAFIYLRYLPPLLMLFTAFTAWLWYMIPDWAETIKRRLNT